MFLVGAEQKKIQENLKTISDDKTYQMLVNKVIKCVDDDVCSFVWNCFEYWNNIFII